MFTEKQIKAAALVNAIRSDGGYVRNTMGGLIAWPKNFSANIPAQYFNYADVPNALSDMVFAGSPVNCLVKIPPRQTIPSVTPTPNVSGVLSPCAPPSPGRASGALLTGAMGAHY